MSASDTSVASPQYPEQVAHALPSDFRIQHPSMLSDLSYRTPALLCFPLLYYFLNIFARLTLISVSLNNALRNYTTDSRAYELLEAIIAANPECGNGREILATVKSVLSGGQAPRDSDFAKLRAVGFEVVSEQNHYKLRFMGNEKYWFTLFKTPSDARSGKNLVSDITKKISIYK